jgi:GTP-binding protein Era
MTDTTPSTFSAFPPPSRRCAVVGLVGRTNSGKSTLLNQLVGEKISIVSPVVQTTRNTIRGILTEKRGQLVFLDTPGLHKAEGVLGTLMNRMARQASAGVDVLLVVFDGSHHPRLEDDGWMHRALHADQPVVFVLNKNDLSPSREELYRTLWEKVKAGTDDVQPDDDEHSQSHSKPRTAKKDQDIPRLPHGEPTWISLSAVHKETLQPLLDKLFELAPASDDLLFPEDIVTDYPRKLAIADTIREKFFNKLTDELPHEIGVKIESLDDKSKPGTWQVSATLYVNKASQKGIVIGPKGRMLKYVRERAEPELSEMFGVKVELELWVKIEPGWMKNFWLLQQMGYAGQM